MVLVIFTGIVNVLAFRGPLSVDPLILALYFPVCVSLFTCYLCCAHYEEKKT